MKKRINKILIFFFHQKSLPHEWQGSLYTDADIQAIIQHSEIKSIIDTCEVSYFFFLFLMIY
jgi:hypothetical protein